MRPCVFLSSLLSVAEVIPNLIYIQQGQSNQASLQTSAPSTFDEIYSTSPQFEPNEESLSHNEMEELIL
jgi:hypothetical protein